MRLQAGGGGPRVLTVRGSRPGPGRATAASVTGRRNGGRIGAGPRGPDLNAMSPPPPAAMGGGPSRKTALTRWSTGVRRVRRVQMEMPGSDNPCLGEERPQETWGSLWVTGISGPGRVCLEENTGSEETPTHPPEVQSRFGGWVGDGESGMKRRWSDQRSGDRSGGVGRRCRQGVSSGGIVRRRAKRWIK